MNWKAFWDDIAAASTNPLEQVQRKDHPSLWKTAEHVVTELNITKEDVVLDVCCGNGLLTSIIHNSCKTIMGVDFSKNLIQYAQREYPDINFRLGSALELDQVFPHERFDKIYLQFSFQYFEKQEEGKEVIKQMLTLLKKGGTIFIGDIPDYEKRWDYYDTPEKRFYRLADMLRSKNKLGKFWGKKEIDTICEELNVAGKSIAQPAHLPYAHYRFDYLIMD